MLGDIYETVLRDLQDAGNAGEYYTPRAVSLTEDLLEKFSPVIESLSLIPSGGGVFEVVVGDELVYSKKTNGRHAEPGEVARLFEKTTGVEPILAE